MSLVNGGRARTVSSTSNAGIRNPEIASLVSLLNGINFTTPTTLREGLDKITSLQQLRFLLKDGAQSHEAKGDFRRSGGFHAFLNLTSGLAGLDRNNSAVFEDPKWTLQALDQLLGLLSAAIEGHAGNDRYFRTRVGGSQGGWSLLQSILQHIHRRLPEDHDHHDYFCGILLAAALDRELVVDGFVRTNKTLRLPVSHAVDGISKASPTEVHQCATKILGDADCLVLPEVLYILVSIYIRRLDNSRDTRVTGDLLLTACILHAVSLSRKALIAAHHTGILGVVLPAVFQEEREVEERDVLRETALLLCQEGISDLGNAQILFQKAITSPNAASFLLEAIILSRPPPCLQFDLIERGFSCAELPSLGRSFPAPETNGYTLSLWVHFDDFDSQAHTTLFGAFDRTQSCFILTYLEKDTRHLILQTAVRGSRPSVRFKAVAFDLGQWYHIAIVHRKSKLTSAAKATLYVDGQMVEHQKASFPSLPPANRELGYATVQTFLGTPQNLSPNTTPGVCKSRWRLASAVLFSDLISDDLISVIFHLGYKYHGNFQDCLGSFQTYGASAALNLRNEELHTGKEDQSDLSVAIRQKASTLIKEDSILLNLSPQTVLDGDDRKSLDETQLVKSLSKQAATKLHEYTRAGGNAIAINGAVPAINDALTQSRGVTMLMGDPLVTVPQDLADASWQLGGCAPVTLQLLCQAKTTEDVEIAVEILFETIRCSWRNSEVMERDNGYAILAMLLKEKLSPPSSSSNDNPRSSAAIPTTNLDRSVLFSNVLRLTLDFIGYDFDDPDQSVINNPLAYKALLIDTNVWRTGPTAVQKMYFEQFIVFASKSKHHRFNLKRLGRMRVLKRMLESLKSEQVSREVMPSYVKVFRTLLPHSMSAETYRALALFITFSVNKRNTNTGRKTKKSDTRSRQRSNSAPGSRQGDDKSAYMTNFEIGTEILSLYSDFLCKPDDESMIKKFAKTVTNKWLLYLMSESSPEVVVLAMRILARLLIVHGEAYVRKFKEKTGGFTVMKYRLKRWWHLPALWPVCFGILFNLDPSKLDLNRSFDLFGFVDLFNSRKEHAVIYPDMLEVIAVMLQSGLKTIVASGQDPSSAKSSNPPTNFPSGPPERLSMSTIAPPNPFLTLVTSQHISTFSTVVQFLADLHSRSQKFRDFAANSNYIQDFLAILFPVVVGVDAVDAITELNARDSTLTFDGGDVVVHPLSSQPPVVRTIPAENAQSGKRMKNLVRGSSFVLVARENTQNITTSSSANGARSPKVPALNEKHVIVQSMLEIVISIFIEQMLHRKDFRGLGLYLKTPPGFVEHQSYFESWLLRNTVSELSNQIALNQTCLTDPKVLINLAKFFTHLGDALFEGWFIDGSSPVLDLSGAILEYLQRPEIASNKLVRLCSQHVTAIRAAAFRTVLLNLSQLQDDESLPFLRKLTYWQNVILSGEDLQSSQIPLVGYLLYGCLVSGNRDVRLAASNLWRLILVQKPGEASALLGQATSPVEKELVANFEKLVEKDDESFLMWIDGHRHLLDALFLQTLTPMWDTYVAEENKKTEDTARSRISRRRERLKQWARQAADVEDFIRRHETTFDHWTANIYSSEQLKHQRFNQDQQDDLQFVQNNFRRMERDIHGPVGVFPNKKSQKWQLDQTEGRNRMRIRLHEHIDTEQEVYQPRKKRTDMSPLRLDTRSLRPPITDSASVSPGGITPLVQSPMRSETQLELFPSIPDKEGDGEQAESTEVEDSFELIDDPNVEDDAFEDKNRKVMRSLHRGDQVKHVSNISRIIGLEAVECLLILGKDNIYIIDNFFQRADLEIVSVWQAPLEERDPYVRMISGRDIVIRKSTAREGEHETRSWRWSEVLSVSKRRFLFRDVAIEIFFGDGRSYLFTVMNPKQRNDLFNSISAKAPQYGTPGSTPSEIAWRYETLRSVDDEPQTLGSKFANVFGQSPSLVATRQWQKGEMSNFHYLMLINTMAGRTYNDLTQYPVFPWVIADYTSQELDLTNPRSFRDLSKPMGCQTAAREAEFRERYRSFAEMGDANAPAFHYGTHYSSAMIVTSFLIRLQPFVKSYLLLQGGTFDHPDRMFFSIEQAWRSASQQNMTDVRELTPEFYYLPEFLTNLNGYDFGLRQQSDKTIDTVELPPWARGDPKIFIQKQREALESPYVSKNLHKWIDLVFGYKQKGEAAFEATNVFHHLSYQGARDLDTITDPVERLATIGIIHNFGQTPYQVFTRAHPTREQTRHKLKRLDIAAESLTRLPSTLLDSEERVASLQYSGRTDRLLCSGAFRLNIPPHHEKYMEWGFSDHSVRFYATDSGKQVGLAEHLHIGQLSCALFADSKTLITAGMDCTISVWSLLSSHKAVDLHPKATLFGHRKPVTVLAISRSFNCLLSCSSAGELFLWDVNRCEFVRKLDDQLNVSCAFINDVNGNIVLCHDSEISMYTLNGERLLRQESGDRPGDGIVSCACYEGAGNEWLERELVFTGHKYGVVRVWSKTIRDGQFELEIVRQLNHADETREDGGNVAAGISCILPMPQTVYTGDEDGRVYEWNCVQRH